eukprot:2637727-Rhodomonas_salina.1
MPSTTATKRRSGGELEGAVARVLGACPTLVLTMYSTPFLNYANLTVVVLHTVSWVVILALRDADND